MQGIAAPAVTAIVPSAIADASVALPQSVPAMVGAEG